MKKVPPHRRDEQIIEAYAVAAKEGQSVEAFLDEQSLDATLVDSVLPSLVKLEVQLARQRGDVIAYHQYRERFPKIDSAILDDILMTPPAPPRRQPSPPLLPPRYRVIELLGEGGIGSVWRIEDREMHRPLAAKVLLERFRSDSQSNQRLTREAMLAGSLQHPGIPPVYEVGELLTGSNFFTMKLVEGSTLETLLQHRQSGQTTDAHLLDIFRTLVDTVSFTHSRGVVHRDLKPANVMVGAFGEVQIMDWGMAKQLGTATEEPRPSPSLSSSHHVSDQEAEPKDDQDTRATASDSSMPGSRAMTVEGDVMGTPAYMPPEQARGELQRVNERADVFALGAILFEILTKRRLYAAQHGNSLLTASAEGETAESLQFLEAVSVDEELKSLCRDCLQLEPEKRPSNGNVVAERLSQYTHSLSQRLENAKLDAAAAQAREQEIRKRRTLVMTGSIALSIVLLTATGVSSWLAVWANKAQDSALTEAETSGKINEFLLDDLLGQSDPNISPDPDLKLRTLLDRASARIENQFTDRPQVEASIRLTIGNSYRALAQYEKAAEHLTRAQELRASEFGSQHPATLEVDAARVNLLRLVGELDAAFALAKTTLEARRKSLGPEDRATIESVNDLALVHAGKGQYDEAEILLLEVRERQSQPQAESGAALLRTINTLGSIYIEAGRLDEAEPLLKEVHEQFIQLHGKQHIDSASAAANLATLYTQLARYDDAERLFLESIDSNRVILNEQHPETLNAMAGLAALYYAQGRVEEAEFQYRDTLKSLREVLGSEHPDTLSAIDNLSTVLSLQGKTEDATPLVHEAYEARKRTLGATHPDTIRSTVGLASIYQKQERFDEAEALYSSALEGQLELFGEDHINTYVTRNNLALLYQWMQRYDEAAAQYLAVIDSMQSSLGPTHPNTLSVQYNLAELYKQVGRYEEAEPLYTRVIEEAESQLGASHMLVIAARQRCAHLYLLSERPENAEPLLRKLLDTYEMQRAAGQEPSPPGLVQAQSNLALSLLEQQQWDEASTWIDTASELLTTKLPDHWMNHWVNMLKGRLAAAQEPTAEAEQQLLDGWQGLVGNRDAIPVSVRKTCLQEACASVVRFYEAQQNEAATATWQAIEAKIVEGDPLEEAWLIPTNKGVTDAEPTAP